MIATMRMSLRGRTPCEAVSAMAHTLSKRYGRGCGDEVGRLQARLTSPLWRGEFLVRLARAAHVAAAHGVAALAAHGILPAHRAAGFGVLLFDLLLVRVLLGHGAARHARALLRARHGTGRRHGVLGERAAGDQSRSERGGKEGLHGIVPRWLRGLVRGRAGSVTVALTDSHGGPVTGSRPLANTDTGARIERGRTAAESVDGGGAGRRSERLSRAPGRARAASARLFRAQDRPRRRRGSGAGNIDRDPYETSNLRPAPALHRVAACHRALQADRPFPPHEAAPHLADRRCAERGGGIRRRVRRRAPRRRAASGDVAAEETRSGAACEDRGPVHRRGGAAQRPLGIGGEGRRAPRAQGAVRDDRTGRMKTDALIDTLAERAAPVGAGRAARILALGAGGGALVSFVAMVLWLGIRPDMAEAMATSAYWMKFFYTLLFAVAGFWTIERLARPGTSSRTQMTLEALPFAGVALVALVRLALVPAAMRMPMAMGHSAHVCPWRIVILALPVFAGTFWA